VPADARLDAPRARRGLCRLVGAAVVLTITSLSSGAPADAQDAFACDSTNFKVAIDVGHTPEAWGATSARGATEYSYNLELARQIEQSLVKRGYSRTTVITVRGTGRAQLLRRTEIANALGADLFLSIHHDDVQDIYHSKWRYNGSTYVFSDQFSGYSLFVSRANLYYQRSLEFAKLLGATLSTRGMYYSAHHAENIPGEGRQLIDRDVGVYLYDDLVVLKFTKAPAVLLEAGVIVNRIEELVLGSPEGRSTVSAAVLEAVNRFCSGRERR
jgi:N-acetylmuramoyl-L-alanine amidase